MQGKAQSDSTGNDLRGLASSFGCADVDQAESLEMKPLIGDELLEMV